MECKAECNDCYKTVSYSIQNWVLYCDKNEYNVPATTDYYTDGDKNEYTNNTPSKIIENSPGKRIYDYFCNNSGKKE